MKAAIVRIRPTGVSGLASLREVWAYRELLWVLVARDIKVRYKQTVVGFAWAVIQPFMTMVVFTLFFGALIQVPSEGIPYPLFSYAALLPWQYFARAMTDGSRSVLSNSSLLTKVYFPRAVLPIAGISAGLVDFAISFVIFVGLMVYYDVEFSLRMLWGIPCILFTVFVSLAAAFWTSALGAVYRDVNYVVPYVVQLLMFMTPVIYPASIVPAEWQVLYALNPMVPVIEGFRWAMLGTTAEPNLWSALISFSIITVLLLLGLLYFHSAERNLADRI